MDIVEVLSTRKYKAGYEVRVERCRLGDEEVTLKSAYTPEGHYIGRSVDAHRLVVRRGIKPEKASPDRNACSIGFSLQKQKWYGWSHRAIYGFAVGDVVKQGDCCASSGWTDEYLQDHPEEDRSLPVGFQAQNLADAKRMAVAFADAVG